MYGGPWLMKGVLLEPHPCCKIESDPSEHACTQLPCSNKRTDYQPQSSFSATHTYPTSEIQPLLNPSTNICESSDSITITTRQTDTIFVRSLKDSKFQMASTFTRILCHGKRRSSTKLEQPAFHLLQEERAITDAIKADCSKQRKMTTKHVETWYREVLYCNNEVSFYIKSSRVSDKTKNSYNVKEN